MSDRADGPAPVVDIEWVWRSRWLVAITHVVVVAWSLLEGLPITWPLVAPALAVSVISNGLVGGRRGPSGPVGARVVLALDLVLLTLLLLGSGGISHPFTFLYLFQVVIAAMVLESRWVWGLVALAAAGYGCLFLPLWLAESRAGPAMHGGGRSMHGHYVGMWVAFGVTGPFAAFVVTRVRQALAEATARIDQARRLQERTARLTALGTLAAGTAHELATPLSSIAVVAGDLARSEHAEVAEDGETIRAQVARCREVLAQLAADSGHGVGQRPASIDGEALAARLLDGLCADRVEVTVQAGARVCVSTVPIDRVVQAVRQLIVNALDASEGPVRCTVGVARGALEIEVRDEGSGMAPDVLARATEPFFTTKPLGEGTGLGLHFVRSIAEQIGGVLELHSDPGRGTTAILTLPPCVPVEPEDR